MMGPPSEGQVVCVLQVATVVVLAYLCVGEFLPSPVARAVTGGIAEQNWARQQVLLLASLSCLVVLIASAAGGCSGRGCTPAGVTGRPWNASIALLAALNVVPVAVAVAATQCK